ncbi:hypothetical protein AQUCO_02600279v1 [Aquilegia coerulea]|uniref:Uncharacterized protein n=1 Tax=Aquilegia coerulea TaxID=218851 RepID=A0A2G5D862_AQUCA|nr:hypothetical protein AQUCO_02600279v1 [Aquilegia coerulea]
MRYNDECALKNGIQKSESSCGSALRSKPASTPFFSLFLKYLAECILRIIAKNSSTSASVIDVVLVAFLPLPSYNFFVLLP